MKGMSHTKIEGVKCTLVLIFDLLSEKTPDIQILDKCALDKACQHQQFEHSIRVNVMPTSVLSMCTRFTDLLQNTSLS